MKKDQVNKTRSSQKWFKSFEAQHCSRMLLSLPWSQHQLPGNSSMVTIVVQVCLPLGSHSLCVPRNILPCKCFWTSAHFTPPACSSSTFLFHCFTNLSPSYPIDVDRKSQDFSTVVKPGNFIKLRNALLQFWSFTSSTDSLGWRLGSQPVMQLTGGGTFRRWGLVGGS
jgi:hypothetical protein